MTASTIKCRRVHHRKTTRERAVPVSISLPLWLKLDAEHEAVQLGLRGISELVQIRLRVTAPDHASNRFHQPRSAGA